MEFRKALFLAHSFSSYLLTICLRLTVDSDLPLYADDSCLVFRDNNINEIEKQLNKNFNSLCDWLVDNT